MTAPVLALLGCHRPEPPDEPASLDPPSNVLLVLLDDLSLDRVAAYDRRPDAIPMPTFDRLAAQGVRFTHAWVEPMCSPTRAALMTGRHPRRTGVGSLIDAWRQGADLPSEEELIPEMLDRSAWDWDRSLTGKWHLASYDGGDPTLDPGEQGFHWWSGSTGNLSDPYGEFLGRDRSYTDWFENDNGLIGHVETYATTDTADDAIDRIAAMREPWFLYLPFNAAHEPFHAPPTRLLDTGVGPTDPVVDKYDAMVRVVDAELGRVLDSMDPELQARTTVIVLADNGTPPDAVRPPTDPLHAKGSVYEAGVNVPLVIAGPYVEHPGTVSSALVEGVDLFATVADIAGVDPEDLPAPIDGRSLRPLLADPQAAWGRRVSFTEKFEPNGFGPFASHARGLRDDRYKLVSVYRRNDQGDVERVEELYDLQQGDEVADLRDDPAYAEVWDALAGELATIEDSFAATLGDQGVPP